MSDRQIPTYAHHMPRHQRTLRVIIEGVGCVDIDRQLFTADGNPRVRVDVISDFDRYGVAPDGRQYVVENADPGPGVVWVTGYRPDATPDREAAYKRANGLIP